MPVSGLRRLPSSDDFGTATEYLQYRQQNIKQDWQYPLYHYNAKQQDC